MAAFTPGNIVVYRVGTGAGALTSGGAAAVFLDEYTTAGVLVQSIALPTADAGTMHALTASSSATSEGLITDAGNGASLLLTGYDAAPGTAAVTGTTAAADPRIVGRVTSAGAVDTGTVLTGFEGGNNIRSAASADGNAIYASGANGVAYTTLDSTATPNTLDTTNTRQIEVVNGQLYYTTGSGTQGVYALGSGTPTSGTQTGTLLPGTGAGTGSNGSSPYGFFFAKLGANATGNDTLYVADSGTGIEKFSLQNGTWTASGQVPFSGATGLTGSVSNGVVTLFATSPTSIDMLSDSSGQTGSIAGGTLKAIATAPMNEVFRGVALAPTAMPAGRAPAATNVSIGDATYVRNAGGSMMENFTVTRSDTNGAFSVNFATADGTAKAGTDYTAETGTLNFAAGGAATQTITVPIDADTNAPASDSYNVNLSNLASTVGSATLSKASATGTIVNPTPIYTIQGTGFTSPLNGQTVTTDGVVTALASNGFYLQDAKGDGNNATSDGIFVFTSSKPTAAVGDFDDVSGTVQEYTPASAGGGAFSTTELGNVTATTTVSQNNALPAAVVIGPDGRLPPTSSNDDADAFFESLEGMRVTVENPVAIGPTNQYGEIETFAGNGAGDGLNARGDALISLGQTSFGNTDTVGGNFNPERVKIDSELTANAVPDVSLGTKFANATGILNYDFGQFGVSATAPLTVTAASTITPGVSTLVGDSTHLTVGSYNIENFSAVAQGQAKVNAVAAQIVNNLKSPDIISLQEVQDDSGPTDDGTTVATNNLASLVGAINAAGGPQYTAIDNPFIGNDTNGGQPGGNIRDAILYRADQVQFVPGSLATIAATGAAIHDQGTAAADAAANKDQQTNNNNPFYASRPPLSANFTFNGQTVTVIDDHFTSKGGSGNLMGSVQPPFDGGEVQRAAQAQAENTYIGGLLGANANANIVVTGDLNEFNNEEPIKVLEGAATISNYSVPAGMSPATAATATYTAGGTPVLTDLEGTLPADQQYDYVFEGNAESLVHVLSSKALTPGAQFQAVHVNSEFADQTSDHDPLVTSYAIAAPVCFTAGTLILTARGEVTVEALRIGDLVATASGALRPIRWLGHRALDCRRHPRPREAMPVRVAAHAFASNEPARDLVVSPGHALSVDGVLIPAAALVNGTTVTQEDRDRVTYWHVELPSHDVIFAEGMPCESYIDCGNRDFFVEAAAVALDGSPDAPAATLADYCLPFHDAGEVVETVRERMRRRAGTLGWRTVVADADLHLLADGIRVEAHRRGAAAVFAMPAGARDVWLMSGASRPLDLGLSGDDRALGVCLRALTVGDGFGTRTIDAGDPRLDAGFHHVEGEGGTPWRWTTGRACLPAALWAGCDGTLLLRVDFHHDALPCWERPVKAARGAAMAS